MIQIKPLQDYNSYCPYCKNKLTSMGVIWQGIHTCIKLKCDKCNAEFVEDLKIGQAIFTPYKYAIREKELFGKDIA